MANKPIPTPDELRQLLTYDPDTGVLIWKARPGKTAWNKRWAGRAALEYVDSVGYKTGKVASKEIRAHRVIWALFHGAWPDQVVDHINGDKTDNRISNLRVVSQAQNAMNRSAAGGASRYKGVSYSRSGPWCAIIQKDRKKKFLGRFKTEEEAARAYDIAARAEFGEYARLNIPT